METNLQVLNKISQKLGGSSDATSVTESLNNIANALGDTNPDVIKSVSDSLEDILEYAGQGGGTGTPCLTINVVLDEVESYQLNALFSGEYPMAILTNDKTAINPIYDLTIDSSDTEWNLMYVRQQVGEDEYEYIPCLLKREPTDLENCMAAFKEGVYGVFITDPTKPASLTVTFNNPK